jgi:hypothetical protein
MRVRILAALALAMAGAGSAAQDAWDALGPGAIGASRAQLAAQVPLACGADVCRPAADAASRFAGAPVERIDLAFDADRLARVTVRFGTQHYARVLDAVRERFGEGADHSYQARAGMAGEFAAGVFVWSRPDLALVLEQYAGKIDRAQLVYGTPQALAELVRDKTATPRGARRDL